MCEARWYTVRTGINVCVMHLHTHMHRIQWSAYHICAMYMWSAHTFCCMYLTVSICILAYRNCIKCICGCISWKLSWHTGKCMHSCTSGPCIMMISLRMWLSPCLPPQLHPFCSTYIRSKPWWKHNEWWRTSCSRLGEPINLVNFLVRFRCKSYLNSAV